MTNKPAELWSKNSLCSNKSLPPEFIEITWEHNVEDKIVRSVLFRLVGEDSEEFRYESIDKVDLGRGYSSKWRMHPRKHEPTKFWWRARRDPAEELRDLESQ
jgi:hypothetical protein